MYVDLNPVRAGIADSLPNSDFTSIQERLRQFKAHQKANNKSKQNQDTSAPQQPTKLLPFGPTNDEQAIPFYLADYLELADWSGRAINPKKRGAIPVIIENT